MNAIPESHRALLQDETGAFAYRAALVSDGSPQPTPSWRNADGGFILINSALGCIRDRNMRARPRVPILIVDPKNPSCLQVRGQVAELAAHGGLEHVNALSIKLWKTAESSPRPQTGDLQVTGREGLRRRLP